jgi:hypothetical protein
VANDVPLRQLAGEISVHRHKCLHRANGVAPECPDSSGAHTDPSCNKAPNGTDETQAVDYYSDVASPEIVTAEVAAMAGDRRA